MKSEASEKQRQNNRATLASLEHAVTTMVEYGALIGRTGNVVAIDTTHIPEDVIENIRDSVWSVPPLKSRCRAASLISGVTSGDGRMYWKLCPWVLDYNEGVDADFPPLRAARDILESIPVMTPSVARECMEHCNRLDEKMHAFMDDFFASGGAA